MLSELPARIKSCSAGSDVSGLEEYAASAAGTADIGAELEIAFRNEAKSFNLREERGLSDMLRLLRFSIEFGKSAHELSINVGKIPFLLISDVLERETISVAERVWTTVEELADELTTPVLFSKGKMTVLRFCNALLRRLSKSCNTEFCGRILMFLAAIYPLSERSAVNISGKINVSNMTGFEEAEDFEAAMEACLPGTNGPSGVDAAAGDATEGGEVDELLTRARSQFASLRHADSSGDLVGADSKEEAFAAVDFNLYKIFWGIQNYVAGDPGKAGAVMPWKEFTTSAETLLAAFEANSFTDSELEQSMHSWENLKKVAILHENKKLQEAKSHVAMHHMDAALPAGNAYAGCKYLTSSQLFALQLKDPVIRDQISTQILFHIHYLKGKLTGTADGDQALSTIKQLENRIYAMLQKTPPNGEHFVKSLKSLLDREQHWAAWKKRGCTPFERVVKAEEVAPVSRKRRRGVVADSTGNSARAPSFLFQFDSTAMLSTLQTISNKIPSFDAHMESYIEAEDPDAGIEEAYHPKNDKVYCWRARRLLANKKLAAFEDMADGDVGKGLKKMNKLLNPQTATAVTTTAVPTAEIEVKKVEENGTTAVVAAN